MQDAEGTITAACQHDSCQQKTWKDFRRKIDPHYRERGRLPTGKTVKDAEYLARRFLETCPPAYSYRGDVWFYGSGIWQQAEAEDLRNQICRCLMRVYGEYAAWVRQNKKDAKVPSITEGTITNVLRCLKSILPQIPRDRDMPCWVDGRSAKVLVVANGILDLTTNEMHEHTPKLFAVQAAIHLRLHGCMSEVSGGSRYNLR